MSTLKSILGLVLSLLLTFGAAYAGSRFPVDEWYVTLNKPSWNPPNWLFGPVWSILYLLMAIAAWLVWKKAGFSGAALALVVFLLQLVLNALWSWLFFGIHRLDIAFLDITLLWVAIICTIVLFWRVLPQSGMMLLPYLLWVTFAAILNLTIWRLNA